MAASSKSVQMGKSIAQLRKQRGISQDQVADYLGVDQGLISKIESGQRNTTLSALEKLCDLFFCSLDDLCQESESPGGQRKQGLVAFRAKGLNHESTKALAAVGRVACNLDRMTQLERFENVR